MAAVQISRVNCDEMDGDRPRQPANRNCWAVARLMSFSQITCNNLACSMTTKHDVYDYSCVHCTFILLPHYLAECESRSLAVYNNEFMLGGACVGMFLRHGAIDD